MSIMFGAADPDQAIAQLEAYYNEGRSERAGVRLDGSALRALHAPPAGGGAADHTQTQRRRGRRAT